MRKTSKHPILLPWILLAPLACSEATEDDEVGDDATADETEPEEADAADAIDSTSEGDIGETTSQDPSDDASDSDSDETGAGRETDTSETDTGESEGEESEAGETDTSETDTEGNLEDDKVLSALQPIGRYTTGVFNEGAAEIVDHHPWTQRLFVVNGADETVDVLDMSIPGEPTLVEQIDITKWGASPNSLAVHDDVLAVAIEAVDPMQPGTLLFFDAVELEYRNHVAIGVLPDMVTFSPDGSKVLVACEGEPADDYLIDPEGSVAIVDISAGVVTLSDGDVHLVDFSDYSLATIDPEVRIFGPGSNVAQDLEPEYITVSADSTTAWVTLQENNAIAVIDIASSSVVDIVSLGFKNHSQPGKGLDASDVDASIAIANWPVFGMYQPDAIASFVVEGKTYLITANEGDGRGYEAFAEEAMVVELQLDPVAFPKAVELQAEDRIGRLHVTTQLGDIDEDGEFERLYSFGARSVAVWSSAGTLIWDSGDQIEQQVAAAVPSAFNANSADNDFDGRSDDKGPEPEGVTVAELWGQPYAFVALERIGGVMVFDLTVPNSPKFVLYDNTMRKFEGVPEESTAGDLGPEGLHVILAEDSPLDEPLLVVANEVSGSTTIYRIIGQMPF